MSQTGLSEFDTTVQQTNVWLNEIAQAMGHPDKRVAYHAMRGVLHALRDRLPVDVVFDLSGQLPTLVRGVFFDSYHPAGKPEKSNKEDFLARVAAEVGTVGGENPLRVTRAVLGVVGRHVSRGEVEQIRGILPEYLRDMWPAEPVTV